MIEVKTYTNFLDHEVKEKIDYLMMLAQHDNNNRMPDNYSIQKLALNDTIAVSIAERNGIPFCYSSIMNRSVYKQSARVLSRYYYHPLHKIRGLNPAEMPSIKTIWRDHAIKMVESQTELAFQLGYDGVFMSQHDKSVRFFTRMYHGLIEKCSIKDWDFDPGKQYRVCNGPDCEHWVISHGKFYLEEV
jgi:hypothetical protein